MQEICVQSLGQENPLKEGMAICSSIHARKTSQTVEPSGLHSTDHKESDATERLTNTYTHTHTSTHIVYQTNIKSPNCNVEIQKLINSRTLYILKCKGSDLTSVDNIEK